MIAKETFKKVIELIRKQEQVNDKITDTLSLFCDGNGLMFTGSEYYYEALMLLLKESMNDEGDYIGWWLYEDVEKVIYLEDGTERRLDTIEELYDFLLENYKENGLGK